MNKSKSKRVAKYTVEKIVDKRINPDGKAEYYLKWKGYADSANSWVHEDDLFCDDLRIEFEAERRIEERKKQDKEKNGFDRGLKPAEILSATNTNGPLLFLIEWKDVNICDLVLAKEAYAKCPDLVIKFYESILQWRDPSKKSRKIKDIEGLKEKYSGAFNHGLIPERIIDATESKGLILFLMKWVGKRNISMVLAEEANIKCPQLVFQFYEAHLKWNV